MRKLTAWYDRTKCRTCRYQITQYVDYLKGVVPGCERPLDGKGYPNCWERRESAK